MVRLVRWNIGSCDEFSNLSHSPECAGRSQRLQQWARLFDSLTFPREYIFSLVTICSWQMRSRFRLQYIQATTQTGEGTSWNYIISLQHLVARISTLCLFDVSILTNNTDTLELNMTCIGDMHNSTCYDCAKLACGWATSSSWKNGWSVSRGTPSWPQIWSKNHIEYASSKNTGIVGV